MRWVKADFTSRVRSPTPANTEKPPWPLATLLIHDEHGLADARTAEQADLATTLVWRKQVHDLVQHLHK